MAKTQSALVRHYLVLYNIASTLGWAYLLVVTLIHLSNLDGASPATIPPSTTAASSTLSLFLSRLPFFKSTHIPIPFEARLPLILRPVYRRTTSVYARVGAPTAVVQTFAILEIVHVLLGFVRASLPTTMAQVASRLFLVWGVMEQFVEVRTNPIFTSMLVSWSLAEVIRYSFFAVTLLGYESPLLLWLRYTSFYVLYITGASSEALLNYATLPMSSPLTNWSVLDLVRGVLFVIWWPGLYVMYTHMIKQRRKVFGKGKTLKEKTN
ncbi:hypothetical protein H0H92_014657 [Tricholoma furcatifolium]|nr:hypothetical protein H0H92_014657 [Tricholoma furcatifolium]